jgi:hypothetical protein
MHSQGTGLPLLVEAGRTPGQQRSAREDCSNPSRGRSGPLAEHLFAGDSVTAVEGRESGLDLLANALERVFLQLVALFQEAETIANNLTG